MILHGLTAMVAGWVQRHQQQVITYLIEENRVLKAQLGGRCLAALAHPLGRARLKAVATIATPDTLMRWDKRLIAQKFDGSKRRTQLGRPPVAEEVERLAPSRWPRRTPPGVTGASRGPWPIWDIPWTN